MKITKVEIKTAERDLDCMLVPAWQVPMVRSRQHVVLIHTDEGITGVGSGGVPVRWDMAGLLLLGQDPFNIEQHVENLSNFAFFIGRPWPLEIALWDIIGKATGQPIARLFGGGQQRLKAYASTAELRPPEQRAEDAQRLRQEGFHALKLHLHSIEPRRDLRVVEAVRKAVGDSMDIMVDAGNAWTMPPERGVHRWDLRTAIYMARALEELGVFWLEEPLWRYDYDDLAELRRQVNLRIAGGELSQGIHDFKAYLDKGCYDVYQTEVTMAGGLFQGRQVAAMVQAHGKMITPHNWTNGIGFAAALQFAASLGQCPYFEFPYEPPAWTIEARDFLLKEPFRIDEEGYVHLPDKPGLGIELDEEKMAKFAAPDADRIVL
jgi:L-alanine-DL-glutamate epimerase-like enolase superfamily enzyme